MPLSADLATMSDDDGMSSAASETIDQQSTDAVKCRRGLREISEIAAVASLERSQTSAAEALAAIAAIAEWVHEEGQGARGDCAEVISKRNGLTHSVEVDGLTPRHWTWSGRTFLRRDFLRRFCGLAVNTTERTWGC